MKNGSKNLLVLSLCLCISFAPLKALAAPPKAAGKQNILVIMVKFPDVRPAFSKDQQQEKYFHKLNRYLESVSYEKASIGGKITDWYTLPQEVKHYHLSRHNLEVEKNKVLKLIQDTVNLADEDEDFSRYSMIFISLGAKHKDYGMMGLCGYPGMLGWQNQLPIKTKSKKQEIPQGVAIFCENAHIGVVFHDMAHILGGVENGKRALPCLYDHDLQAQKGSFRDHYQFYLINAGYYDPMSCHYYDLQKGPPGLCAWTKLRLGWIDTKKIVEIGKGDSKTVSIGPLSSGKSKVHVIRVPITPSTYYLIENRQAIGPDKNIPAHGILIFYCDDAIAECRHGKSPVKLVDANPAFPQLKGAPFTVNGENEYEDEANNISIKILGQEGQNYKVRVSNNS